MKLTVFEAAHQSILSWDDFPWHKTEKHLPPDADRPHSSQAFAISVWGTIQHPSAHGVRLAIAGLLGNRVIAAAMESIEPSIELEFREPELLNERGGQATNVDTVVRFEKEVVLVVESKLTEPFGSCGQWPKYCSGTYGPGSDLKTRSGAPCRLEVSDGRRTPRHYWEVMWSLSKPDSYPADSECPFRGPSYQVMRNIATAARLAQVEHFRDWRVVFAYPSNLSKKSTKAIVGVQEKLQPSYQMKILQLDYERLAESLLGNEDEMARGLGRHLKDRLDPLAASGPE